jgi:hypothetical protein
VFNSIPIQLTDIQRTAMTYTVFKVLYTVYNMLCSNNNQITKINAIRSGGFQICIGIGLLESKIFHRLSIMFYFIYYSLGHICFLLSLYLC